MNILIFLTMSVRLSVPRCGFEQNPISFGAPNFTKVSRTNRFLPFLSFTRVFSFPSENVPAPPSPNWTFEEGFNLPLFQNAFTESILSSTCSPRSKSIGAYPFWHNIYAQKSPAGPVPAITGLPLSSFIPSGSGI